MGNDGTSTKFKYLKKLTTSSPVISALLLNDNTLAINFSNEELHIYNTTSFNCEHIFTSIRLGNPIQLTNNFIVSSTDSIIEIFTYSKTKIEKIKRIDAHKKHIFTIIELSNNRFSSCSIDAAINIYSSNLPFNIITTLKGHTSWVTSLLYYQKKDILISSGVDKRIIFWNMKTYQYESIMFGEPCCCNNGLIIIEKELIICSIEKVYIYDLNTLCLVDWIRDDAIVNISDLSSMNDGNIVCSGIDRNVYILDMKKKQIVKVINKGDKGKIIKIDLINNSFIVTYGESITIWKL